MLALLNRILSRKLLDPARKLKLCQIISKKLSQCGSLFTTLESQSKQFRNHYEYRVVNDKCRGFKRLVLPGVAAAVRDSC